MGSVTDLLNNTQPKTKKGPPCSVCTLLASLPVDESAALVALLSDPGVRYTWLADQLRDQGIADIDAPAYGRHSRGACGARSKLR